MTEAAIAETFQSLRLTQLREAEWNPRKTFEKKALDELTASVKSKGVLVPLLVRPGAGGAFEIVAGARRYRAARAAGLEAVPANVRELSDAEALEAAVIENAQRESVHPLEEGEGFRALLAHPGYDVQSIANKIGMSVSHVYQRLQLAKLITPAKEALLEEKISAAHANAIARLVEKDQEAALEQCLDEYQPMTVRELQDWIERSVHLDLHAAPWKKDDADLLPSAGACLTCTKRTGTTPGLWPDVKRKDTCTDRECFAAKRAAWIALTIADEKEKSGIDLVQLSTDYSPSGERKPKKGEAPPLPQSQWVRVPERKKMCDDVRPAIVVDGHHGNVGERMKVCTNPKCKIHHGAAAESESGGGNDDYRKRQLAAEKRAKRERIERRAILTATVEQVQQLDDEDLFAVAAGLLVGIDHETSKNLVRHHGWPVKEQQYGTDYRGAALRALEERSGAPLARAVLELALLHTLAVGTNGSADPKLLLATAKRHGVDVAAVRKSAGEAKALAKAKGALKAAGKGKGRGKKGAETS